MVTIILIPIFIIMLFTYKTEKQSLKEAKNWHEKLSSYIIERQQRELLVIIKNEDPEESYNDDFRILAAAALIDLAAEKALVVIMDIIKEEIKNKNMDTEFIRLLYYYTSLADNITIYDYLFESILSIQEKYFTPRIYQPSATIIKVLKRDIRVGKILRKYAHAIGFEDLENFVSYNIIKALQKTFNIYKDKESFELEKLAKLCRANQEVTLDVLMYLLEIGSELGEYKEFEMTFIPSKNISKLDYYIDVNNIREKLQSQEFKI